MEVFWFFDIYSFELIIPIFDQTEPPVLPLEKSTLIVSRTPYIHVDVVKHLKDLYKIK